MQEYYEEINMALKSTNNAPCKYVREICGTLKSQIPYKLGINIPLRSKFLAELQYLCTIPYKKHYILYVGSRDCSHIELLVKLFPNVKIIIINKDPVDISNCRIKRLFSKSAPTINMTQEEWAKTIIHYESEVFTIEQEFTPKIAQFLSILHPIFIHYYNDIDSDEELLASAAEQYYYVNLLQPSGYLLYFVPPRFDMTRLYPEENEYMRAAQKFGNDYIENYNAHRRFLHLEGELTIFLFATPNNYASMLYYYGNIHDISNKSNIRLHSYDCINYYNTMNYYSAIGRHFRHCKNPYISATKGIDNCNECASEASIWEDYLRISKRELSIEAAIESLSFCISKKDYKIAAELMHGSDHGSFFDIKKEDIIRRINFVYINPQKLVISDQKAAQSKRVEYKASIAEICNIITKGLVPNERAEFIQSISKSFIKVPICKDLSQVRNILSAPIRLRPNAADSARGTILCLMRFIYTSKCRALAVVGPVFHESILYSIFTLYKIPIIYINYGTRYNDSFYSLPEFQAENMTIPNIYKYTIGKDVHKLAELKNIKQLGVFLHMSNPNYFTEIHFSDICEFYTHVIHITKPIAYLAYFNPFCQNVYEYVPNVAPTNTSWPIFSFYKSEMWIIPYTPSWQPSLYFYGLISQKKPINKIKYDAAKIKRNLLYYSQIYRAFNWFPNKFEGICVHYDSCGDCALEAAIIDDYCSIYNNSFSDIYNFLGKNQPIYLQQRGHGLMTKNNIKNKDILRNMLQKEYLVDIL
jgi:hypothetical protein